jgi:hypothetical protein
LREIHPCKKRTLKSYPNIGAITRILLIEGKSFGVFWSFGEDYMRMYRDGRQIMNRHKRCIKERRRIKNQIIE